MIININQHGQLFVMLIIKMVMDQNVVLKHYLMLNYLEVIIVNIIGLLQDKCLMVLKLKIVGKF